MITCLLTKGILKDPKYSIVCGKSNSLYYQQCYEQENDTGSDKHDAGVSIISKMNQLTHHSKHLIEWVF